jgi:putative acetyltransferase
MSVEVRALEFADAPAILQVMLAAQGGLAREVDEMDLAYVEGFLEPAIASGVALGAWDRDRLAGFIEAARIGPRQFAHVLSNLTVAVHPDWQGRGFGRALFEALFAAARAQRVERIELMAREGNTGAIRLYETLGFRVDGRFEGRVRLADGTTEADIAMGLLL